MKMLPAALAASLLLAAALSARTASPLKRMALAKPAAAAATQAVGAGDLTGFWQKASVDSTDPEFISRDTLQTYFGADGKLEVRSASLSIDITYPEENYTLYYQEIGAWKVESGSLVITYSACWDYDSEGDVTDCLDPDAPSDTVPLTGWEIKTIDGKKALSMPDPDSAEADEVWFYVGTSAAFTVPEPPPSSIRPRFAARQAGRRLFRLHLEGPAPSGRPALDLRGRSVPAARMGRGFFFYRP